MEEIKKFNIKAKELFSGIKNKKSAFAVSLGVLGMILILLSEIVSNNRTIGEKQNQLLRIIFGNVKQNLKKGLKKLFHR